MRKTSVTILNHPSQLRPLSVWRFKRTRGLGRFKFPETFQHKERDLWESDLNRYYYACGCDTGAKGVVIFTFAASALCVWRWSHAQSTLLQATILLIVAAVAGGLIGKLIGLAIAGRKLELLKRDVIAAWKIDPLPTPERTILCG
jgi:multisubunit Na+/H+ antiporter MnhG subunit